MGEEQMTSPGAPTPLSALEVGSPAWRIDEILLTIGDFRGSLA